jgi:hypothetical protein
MPILMYIPHLDGNILVLHHCWTYQSRNTAIFSFCGSLMIIIESSYTLLHVSRTGSIFCIPPHFSLQALIKMKITFNTNGVWKDFIISLMTDVSKSSFVIVFDRRGHQFFSRVNEKIFSLLDPLKVQT